MGIARGAARLLLEESSLRPFRGSVLTLGRQKIFFELKQLEDWAKLHKVNLVDSVPFSEPSTVLTQDGGMDDKTFFYKLGFKEVESSDYSEFQQADQIFDLNLPIPEHLYGKYDCVIDSGTLEHVFNTPQALENIFNLLKPEGRVIHLLPTSNYVDHGFYSFSPTLFSDFYITNNWNIETSRIIEITQRPDKDLWKIYNYTPGSLNALSFGGFDKGYLINTFFVVVKTKESTCVKIPQQGIYQSAGKWKKSARNTEKNINSKSLGSTAIDKLKGSLGFLRSYPLLYSFLRTISTFVTRRSRMPKLVAKY